jgi:catechol 2,3-dioxygenase-like lactoylglutathione lyase family enzyme
MTTPALTTPQPARHAQPTAKVSAMAYLLLERPDLDQAERFLNDFGLQTVQKDENSLYLRTLNNAPWCYRVSRAAQTRFVGMGFTVATRAELAALAQLPGASAIESLAAPGAGEVVRLTDPSGFRIEVVHGRNTVAPLPRRAPLPANHDTALPRINSTQRPPAQPPEILKLGHVALEVAEFQKTCAWYTQHLGFIPSDVQVLPDGSPGVTFMRLDLGDTPADHHTVALAQTFRAALSHCAFEVVDVDAIGMGQRVLRERGWHHAWGMGRHILGSQIFDYWSDPWGAHHEHYCDGDAFTNEHPMGVHPFSAKAMAQWGQTMPPSFVKPRLSLALIKTLVHNLRTVPDVTLKKLIILARSFS